MRKIFGSVWFRIAALVLSVLLQLGVYVCLFLFFSEYGVWFTVICFLLSLIAIGHVLLKNIIAEYKLAWVVPILLFPIFGGVLYLFFGHSVLNKRERRRLSVLLNRREDAPKDSSVMEDLRNRNPVAAQQAQYLEQLSHSRLTDRTQVTYYPVGEAMLESLLGDLRRAKRFIFMEYFILSDGEMWRSILSVLEEKARSGVDVRIMYDDLGSLFVLPSDFAATMAEKGIKTCPFNRFRHIFNSRFNNRDHRKICVVDGNVGYTGGINIADEYINRKSPYGHWKDTAVRLYGRGVAELTSMFLAAWDYFGNTNSTLADYLPTETASASGFVLPFSSMPASHETCGKGAYLNMINKARDYVYITTPYLVIDGSMITALTSAAKAGVDVRIITPGIPDKKIVYFLTRSYYKSLLDAGVRIFEYTPGFIHAKNSVSDDSTAMVGTVNLDYRSLYLHFECAVWMHETDCVADIKRDFLETQEKCREITFDQISKIFVGRRASLAFLRLFAPLL